VKREEKGEDEKLIRYWGGEGGEMAGARAAP